MKDFNEFIEYRKPLQRVMDSLNESDGIMLESMFYEFAKQQIVKAKNLPIADVVVPKGTLCCPECKSTDLKVAIHTDYKECNKCYHYWVT